MTDIRRITDDFLRSYQPPEMPPAFFERYQLMACLSAGHGTETFLVQPRGGTERLVAKRYNKQLLNIKKSEGSILGALSHPGLPALADEFEDEATLCTVRQYVEGQPLDRYAEDNTLTTQDAVNICLKLCDILEYLHGQTPPVIHRDIKPQNVVVREDGSLALIDFDIARLYDSEAETDTQFFGTRHYAAPEQYGFMQTDGRADIFSLGVLLRWLVSGSERHNDNVALYKPVAKIIDHCTAFAPEGRYQTVNEVKKALQKANPQAQGIRAVKVTVVCLLAALVLTWGGIRLYDYVTYNPFSEGNLPAYLSDEERVDDALAYMEATFNSDLFTPADDIATVGDLRTVLVEIGGLDSDYVWALPTNDVPGEYPEYFLPWGWDEGQTVPRDIAAYCAVKLYWPEVVADWSSLKEDTGEYPGVRVALDFCEQYGILTGANRPDDIQLGELALIFANAHRVFASGSVESEA